MPPIDATTVVSGPFANTKGPVGRDGGHEWVVVVKTGAMSKRHRFPAHKEAAARLFAQAARADVAEAGGAPATTTATTTAALEIPAMSTTVEPAALQPVKIPAGELVIGDVTASTKKALLEGKGRTVAKLSPGAVAVFVLEANGATIFRPRKVTPVWALREPVAADVAAEQDAIAEQPDEPVVHDVDCALMDADDATPAACTCDEPVAEPVVVDAGAPAGDAAWEAVHAATGSEGLADGAAAVVAAGVMTVEEAVADATAHVEKVAAAIDEPAVDDVAAAAADGDEAAMRARVEQLQGNPNGMSGAEAAELATLRKALGLDQPAKPAKKKAGAKAKVATTDADAEAARLGFEATGANGAKPISQKLRPTEVAIARTLDQPDVREKALRAFARGVDQLNDKERAAIKAYTKAIGSHQVWARKAAAIALGIRLQAKS